jgi:hypothetical protein
MPLAPTQWMWNGSVDEIHQPDRRALDEVVFDVLGLTAGEHEAVYEAVVNLARSRLEKARSVLRWDVNGTMEIVGAGSEPAPTIPTIPTGMVALRPAPTIPTIPMGMVAYTTRPNHPHNCNRNGRPYESATTGARAAGEGTERIAMGCEWNNGNCNRNGRLYDPPLPSPQLQREWTPIRIRHYWCARGWRRHGVCSDGM